MSISHDASAFLGKALRSVHAGARKLASRTLGAAATRTLSVWSPSFTGGGWLPRSATADGEGVPPELRWSGVPAGTRSLAVVCEDPDAPFPRPFVHWMVWDIPPTADKLDPSALEAEHVGKNSTLRRGYTPAAPPPGHGPHRYHFQVFALDVVPELDEGTGRSALLRAMRGHVLAWGEITGDYERR